MKDVIFALLMTLIGLIFLRISISIASNIIAICREHRFNAAIAAIEKREYYKEKRVSLIGLAIGLLCGTISIMLFIAALRLIINYN